MGGGHDMQDLHVINCITCCMRCDCEIITSAVSSWLAFDFGLSKRRCHCTTSLSKFNSQFSSSCSTKSNADILGSYTNIIMSQPLDINTSKVVPRCIRITILAPVTWTRNTRVATGCYFKLLFSGNRKELGSMTEQQKLLHYF